MIDEVQVEKLLHRVITRKRADHYQRAVDEGIITKFQRERLLTLLRKELNEMVSDAAKEIHTR